MGPRTGRAAGYCAGYEAPGWATPYPGRGRAWWGSGGRGAGWRHRHWYYATGLPRWAGAGHMPVWEAAPPWAYGPYGAPPAPEQEVEFLRNQAEWLQQQLADIGQRLAELEKGE